MKILNKLIEEIVYPEDPQMITDRDRNQDPVTVDGVTYTPIKFRGITILNHYRDGVVDTNDLDNAVENGLLDKTVATTESGEYQTDEDEREEEKNKYKKLGYKFVNPSENRNWYKGLTPDMFEVDDLRVYIENDGGHEGDYILDYREHRGEYFVSLVGYGFVDSFGTLDEVKSNLEYHGGSFG